MSKIVFRGKTYNSVFDMPNDIREAYQIEKSRHPENNMVKPLTDLVDMPDEVKAMYERALGNVKQKPGSSQPLKNLPNMEDIYRRSAPANMRNLPSDESVYRPSPPLAPPSHQAIEPDTSARRLALTLAVLILLAGIAFFVLQTMS